MVDTRAGFWLQLIVGRPHAGSSSSLFCIFGETDELIFRDMFALAIFPASLLLPIVGILLVTSEWTQRTALITFTLVPKRMRVMSAKLAAGLVLGLIAARDRARRRRARRSSPSAASGRWALAVFGQIVLLVLIVAAQRRRLRRGVPELGAGDRPLLRAARRLGGARRDPVPQRRRAVAGHDAHDRRP